MAPKASLHYFKDDGMIPNHPTYPVIVYKGAFQKNPSQIESIFNQNNWRNSWVNGVFGYHHYHSNSHEVLGVRSGSATLLLGGKKGEMVEVITGDVIVLPAGTGHKRLKASEDFKIVGAYPNGMDYNVKIGKADERPDVLEDIQHVPQPKTDPVYGDYGAVIEKWTS